MFSSALALLVANAAPVFAAEADVAEVESSDSIIVTGVNAPTTSSTGLPLTFMETPQSVTIIDQQRIQDFALTSMKELLKQVVGVNVDDQETDRTTYTSRGFDVTNFQIDGVGLPLLDNLTFGDTDSFQYERIDIIRGANGLTTGVGNPSAVINYIRKRPLAESRVTATAYVGSWNQWRGEADVSAPINDDWGVRAFGAHEESKSYLDKYSFNRDLFGIVMSGKITPDLTATAGYTRQQKMSDSPSWVGLYLNYSDFTPIDYGRSANAAPPWAYWNNTNDDVFGELAYSLGEWTVKGTLTYRGFDSVSRIMNPNYLPDRATGFYLGDTSEFETHDDRVMGDLNASGSVHAFGQEHKLTMGVSYARGHVKEYQGRAVDTGNGLGAIVLPDFNGPDRFNPALPSYNPKTLAKDVTTTLWRAFFATQINFTDQLHMVGGVSYAKLKDDGFSYGQPFDTNQGEFNPYAGLLFDLTSSLTAYASYTTIFYPQNFLDINRRQLDPVKGKNIEAGLKANLFDKRFYATAAIFRSEQTGLARSAGSIPDPVFGNFFYYVAEDRTRSEGFELEVAGRVAQNWSVSGGYTKLSIKDGNGVKTRSFVPRQTFKFSTTYTLPEFNNASIGAQLRWQSSIKSDDLFPGAYVPINASAYTVVDLQAGVDVIDNLRASLVVRNVTNKLYYTSLVYGSYGIGQYAAPRNFTASLSYRF